MSGVHKYPNTYWKVTFRDSTDKIEVEECKYNYMDFRCIDTIYRKSKGKTKWCEIIVFAEDRVEAIIKAKTIFIQHVNNWLNAKYGRGLYNE